jgi:hypothetical protein
MEKYYDNLFFNYIKDKFLIVSLFIWFVLALFDWYEYMIYFGILDAIGITILLFWRIKINK